jgi:hypothetical protein
MPSYPLPSYLTRSPSGYTCSHNYQITTNIHINNIFTLSTSSPSSITGINPLNSLFTNNVSSIDISLSYSSITLFRDIHFHHIIIHSKQLSLVSSSLVMFNHCLLDHNPMFNDMVFECIIQLEMLMILIIHQLIQTLVNQVSQIFTWLKWLFDCTSICIQQVMVDHRVIFR